MPEFDVIPMAEATAKTATGRSAKRLQEYLDYIQRVQPGQAGRLRPGEGERVTTVRRRLGAAAKLAETKLVIKRVGEEVYFWVAEEAPKRRASRRPRKASG